MLKRRLADVVDPKEKSDQREEIQREEKLLTTETKRLKKLQTAGQRNQCAKRRRIRRLEAKIASHEKQLDGLTDPKVGLG